MKENILTVILSTLDVKYTQGYADHLYWETPDKYSFSGLKYMLSQYGIDGEEYRSERKSLSGLGKPFVAQMDTGFLLVSDLRNGDVYCRDESGRHVIYGETFLGAWTGNALMLKKKDEAGEPGFAMNRRRSRAETARCLLVALSCVALFVTLFYSFGVRREPLGLTALLAVPFSGLTVWAAGRYAAAQKSAAVWRDEIALRRSVACRKDVLSLLLRQQPYYEVTDEDTSIRVGAPEAGTCLTLIGDPCCPHCAKAHKEIARMLKTNADVQVRYVLTSQDGPATRAGLYLLSSYYEQGGTVLDTWFSLDGKARKALLRERGEIWDSRAKKELDRHLCFVGRNRIGQTPMLLVDGYRLPPELTPEDLGYTLFPKDVS